MPGVHVLRAIIFTMEVRFKYTFTDYRDDGSVGEITSNKIVLYTETLYQMLLEAAASNATKAFLEFYHNDVICQRVTIDLTDNINNYFSELEMC